MNMFISACTHVPNSARPAETAYTVALISSVCEIGPTPCDKKCCSEHQTLFACARGSGHETKL